MKDESQQRKVPRGRYDTTYRREYLNFNNVSFILNVIFNLKKIFVSWYLLKQFKSKLFFFSLFGHTIGVLFPKQIYKFFILLSQILYIKIIQLK
jgi:hypothetical protein